MIRKTLTILSLIGLLLSVGLWGVSYCSVEYLQLTDTSVLNYTLVEGRMRLLRVDREILRAITHSIAPQPGVIHIWGFDGWRTSWRPHYDLDRDFYGVVALPFWPLVLLFGSTLWLACIPLLRRRKRKKLGLCVKCGYNLKGLTELRCPECGETFDNSCSARP